MNEIAHASIEDKMQFDSVTLVFNANVLWHLNGDDRNSQNVEYY